MVKRFIIAFVLVALVAGALVGFNIFRDRAIQQIFATMQAPTMTPNRKESMGTSGQPPGKGAFWLPAAK